jgi:hypothetical protein
MDVAEIMSRKDGPEKFNTECFMRQLCSETPFLVGLRYAFNTASKAFIVLGK